jgi:2-polyprenyl-3-methyl-5-hydroxy-6-metoxy-1,4-benzoquinol methylase
MGPGLGKTDLIEPSCLTYNSDYFNIRKKIRLFGKYRFIKKLKHPFWNRIIRKYMTGGKLLDIGCAEGDLLEWASSHGFCPTGIDVSEYILRENKKKNELLNYDLITSNIQKLPFKKNSFQIITCFDVLEHIKNPDSALLEILRCLQNNGLCIISVPNLNSLGHMLKKEQWFAYSDPTHISLHTIEFWIQHLQKQNFTIITHFSDTFWDTPYFPHLPILLQHIVARLLFILFWFGIEIIPSHRGENLYIIARKDELK